MLGKEWSVCSFMLCTKSFCAPTMYWTCRDFWEYDREQKARPLVGFFHQLKCYKRCFSFSFFFFFCLCWLKLIVKVFSSMKSNIILGDVKVMRPIFTETTSSNLIMHFLLHYLLILIIYCYKHHWNNMQKQVCDLYFPTT